VLAAGGYGTGFLSSAELFDPVAGAGEWAFTGSMHEMRWETAAALLPDGRVLVAGGTGNNALSPVRTAEVYDPATGTWATTGSMSHERRTFTLTVLVNGKVLAAGGFDTNGAVGSVELYDPTNGAWTASGPLQTPRSAHTATRLTNGLVLVAGGAGPAQSGSTPIDPVLNSAEIYDPATGTWTNTGSMGQPRQAHTAIVLPGGKILVAGGMSYFGSVFPTSAEVYDPGTGKWSPTLPLVSGRQDHSGVLLPDGKVLFAGGFNTTDTGPTTELYDPTDAVATPPILTTPTRSVDGAIQFTFRNTPGQNFQVMGANDLGLAFGSWTSLGTATEISPGRYQFTDTTMNGAQGFYRVQSP
jgi:hypothetical protein